LEKNSFTAENGLLTSTLKICRHAITKRYQKEIEELYQTAEDTISKLRDIVLSVVSTDKILDDETIYNLGADSLSTVRLVAKINEQFQQNIPLQFMLKVRMNLNH
jgi:acyl carrier protein